MDKSKHENFVLAFESGTSYISTLQYDESKTWLNDWYEERTKGAILRSKVDWYEQGEKSSKFFLNLEKRNSQKNTIRKIFSNKNSTDVLVENDKAIMEHVGNFYKNLFSRKSVKEKSDCAHFLEKINTPTISLHDKTLCNKELSIDELEDSLLSMNANKSPGNDGLTIEFYKTFWTHLKNPLFESAKYSKIHGSLSTSQRQAIIKLLEKKEKDKRYIQNWRPISLLNVDTKIISKAFAVRLNPVLSSII